MTFAAAGSWLNNGSSGGTTISMTPHASGNLMIVIGVCNPDTGSLTNVTGGSTTSWAKMGTTFTGTNTNNTATLWAGTTNSTSTANATLTGTGLTHAVAAEFTSTVGSWSLDKQGGIDTLAGTNTWASLTPAAAGELYVGYAINHGTASAGSTSGYVYNANPDGSNNGALWNVNCTSSAQAPVWGDSGQAFGLMALIQEGTGATSGPVLSPAIRTLQLSVPWTGGRRGARGSR